MRAAAYIRVSTAEQKLHGFSLDAQRELLQKYADEHDMKLIGVYADEGKSASKQLHRRTEILRLLEDAESGKFDVILFKDLTRWSRNPSQFYAVQDRLDKCGVSWIAVEQPNLETVTASGKLIVGIHISVAAHESAQTSERIKFVNASRVQKGGVITSNRYLPLGYKIGEINGNKRVIIDENMREIVNAIFDTYESTQSIGRVLCKVEEMGFHTWDKTLRVMFKNPIYKGVYHGVENYCEPYLDAERWERIKRLSEQHHYTAPKKSNVYLFSSLVKCKECGGTMVGHTYGGNRIYYRCKRYDAHTCTHKTMIREDILEQYLIDMVDDTLKNYEATVKPKKQKSPAPIRAKLNRLNELYVEGIISRAEFDKKRAAYEDELKSLDTPPVSIKNVLKDGWLKYYTTAPKEAKKAAWRSIIDKIEVDNENSITATLIG